MLWSYCRDGLISFVCLNYTRNKLSEVANWLFYTIQCKNPVVNILQLYSLSNDCSFLKKKKKKNVYASCCLFEYYHIWNWNTLITNVTDKVIVAKGSLRLLKLKSILNFLYFPFNKAYITQLNYVHIHELIFIC